MIKDLAEILRVTDDTVINEEIRGVRPTAQNFERVETVVARLDLH